MNPNPLTPYSPESISSMEIKDIFHDETCNLQIQFKEDSIGKVPFTIIPMGPKEKGGVLMQLRVHNFAEDTSKLWTFLISMLDNGLHIVLSPFGELDYYGYQ